MVRFNPIANTTDDNATVTLHAFLKGLNAKVTRATVWDELPMHPDFPSLLSMSDLLTDWKIDNAALQLNTVKQLRELPMPFIAHLNKDDGWYVLVTELRGNRITYTDSHDGRRTEPVDEFEKNWSGVVLLAEADEQSGETEYAQNRPNEIRENLRSSFVLAGSLLIALFVVLTVGRDLTATNWLLLFTKATGLTISALLVAKQLGSKNALTDRLCQLNGKTNCDGVLNSPGAKLWGWLSWADVGLLYFAGGLLIVLMIAVQPSTRPLLHWLALLAMPYTFFSIYYQARVVRQWCTLCLAVQGILLTESILAVTQLSVLPNSWQSYTGLLTAFLLPTLAWVLAKTLLTNVIKGQQEHDELLRLKRNPDLFQALLMQQPKMPPVPDDLHPIIIGNPDAERMITMVTNPFCGPCAKMHRELYALTSRNTNVKANIIFTCDGTNGPATQVAVQVLALAKQNKANLALSEWYGQSTKNFDAWANRFPVDTNGLDLMAMAEQHSQWCRLAGITETPTVYVENYQLPQLYQLNSLRRLIDQFEPTKTYPTFSL